MRGKQQYSKARDHLSKCHKRLNPYKSIFQGNYHYIFSLGVYQFVRTPSISSLIDRMSQPIINGAFIMDHREKWDLFSSSVKLLLPTSSILKKSNNKIYRVSHTGWFKHRSGLLTSGSFHPIVHTTWPKGDATKGKIKDWFKFHISHYNTKKLRIQMQFKLIRLVMKVEGTQKVLNTPKGNLKN